MLRNLFKKSHSQNTLEIIHAAFPMSLADDVSEVMTQIPVTDIEPHINVAYKVHSVAGDVTVPYRVYFPELLPDNYRNFTETKKAILAAIFTRHQSGYQRENWAGQLTAHPSDWSTPFLALLLGDYVQEILVALDQRLGDEWGPLFQDFATRNPEWRRPLNHRMLTYWDIYYRHQSPRFVDYAGYRVAERLGLWDKKTAPNLTRTNNRLQQTEHHDLP